VRQVTEEQKKIEELRGQLIVVRIEYFFNQVDEVVLGQGLKNRLDFAQLGKRGILKDCFHVKQLIIINLWDINSRVCHIIPP